MKQNNRSLIGFGILIVIIGIVAVIVTTNPQLFGTAVEDGGSEVAESGDGGGGGGESSDSGGEEVVIDEPDNSEVDEVGFEIDENVVIDEVDTSVIVEGDEIVAEGVGDPLVEEEGVGPQLEEEVVDDSNQPAQSSGGNNDDDDGGSSGSGGAGGEGGAAVAQAATQVPPTATRLPATAIPVIAPDGGSLTIQQGYTISELARYLSGLYGQQVTVEQLEQLNPDVNPNDMQIGSTLIIPTPVPVDTEATQQAIIASIPEGETLGEYVVQPGDTISQIAAQISETLGRTVTVDEIEGINAVLIDPNTDLIVPGEQILVPATALSTGEAVSAVQCFDYSVQPGDTFDILADLAQAAGSYTVDDIRLLNPGITDLQAGQTICLPRVDRSGQTANARAAITGISFFCPGDAASMTRQRVIRVSFSGTTFSVFPGSLTLYYNGQVVQTLPFRIPGGGADGGFGFAADFPYQGPGTYRAVATPTNAGTDTGAEQSHECTYVYPTATPIPTNTPLPSIPVGQIVGGVAGTTTPDSITGSCTPTEISFTVDGSSGAFFAGSYVLVGPNGNPVANDNLDIFFDAKTVTNSVSSLVPGVYTLNIDPGDGSANILYAFECSAQSVGQVVAVPTDTPTPSPTPTNTLTPTATATLTSTPTETPIPPLTGAINISCGSSISTSFSWQGGDPASQVDIAIFNPAGQQIYGRSEAVSTGSFRRNHAYSGTGTYRATLSQGGTIIAEQQVDCTDPVDAAATQNAMATATQVAVQAQATIDAFNATQTQIVNSLNATATANANNTGGTATAVVDQINATGTAAAGLVPAAATLTAPQQATSAGVPPTATVNVPATATPEPAATVTGAAITTPDAGTTNPTSIAQVATTAPAVTSAVVSTGVVIPSVGLNVHNAPSLTAPVITALPRGTQVDIVGQTTDSGWLQITAPSVETGWVVSYLIDTSSADQCTGVTNAPAAVVEAFDALLPQFLDPDPAQYQGIKPAPGVVIRVESPDWIYYEATGLANVETREPIGCEMPFEIGSNTKMMTATVILQLQEDGLLNIDDPLSDYLPEYAEALPFGEDITLRMLLNHTSGIFSYTDNAPDGTPGIMEGDLADAELLEQGYTPDELIQFVIEHGEPNFEPGAEGQWSYSNTNYVLLGIIIENLTGQDLATVFDERIFTPLGMNDTFLWNDVPQDDFGLPEAYYVAPFDQDTITWNMSQGWAAGGVISTAEDMHLYIRGLLNGALFENDDTLAIMQEGVFAPGVLANYGLGLMSGLGQGDTWGHGGQTLGFESTVIYNVTNDITIIVWTNAAEDLAALGSFVTVGALQEAGIEP